MKKNISFITLNVTILVILSKILALVREIVLAYAYGTSTTADAYTLVQSLVTTLEGVFMASTLAFMPLYQAYKLKKDSERLAFLNSMYTVLTVVSLLVSIFCVFSGDFVFKILSPGLNQETYTTATDIFKILVFAIPLNFLVTMAGQHLRGENSLLIPAAVSIPAHLLVIVGFIFIAPKYGIQGVSICFVCGLFVQFLIQSVALVNKNYHYKWIFEWRNQGLRQLIWLTIPMIVSGSIENITSLVSKLFAASLPPGGIATLNYANKLSLVIISLLASGPATIYYTKMSELYVINQKEELTEFFIKCVNTINMFVIPLTIGMIVLKAPIIEIFFERGAFTSTASAETMWAFVGYTLGIFGHGIRILATRLFYTHGNQKIPLINGILIIILCMFFNTILVKPLGVFGLAFSASAATTIGGLLLLKKLTCIGISIPKYRLFKPLIAYGLSAIIMGFFVNLVYDQIQRHFGIQVVSVLVSTVLGVLLYFAVLYTTYFRTYKK